MKPSIQFTTRNTRQDRSTPVARLTSAPKTDCFFQAPRDGFERSAGGRLPSFRGISEDYFNREVHGHFAVEFLCFALIVGTAAVPVIHAIAAFWQTFA